MQELILERDIIEAFGKRSVLTLEDVIEFLESIGHTVLRDNHSDIVPSDHGDIMNHSQDNHGNPSGRFGDKNDTLCTGDLNIMVGSDSMVIETCQESGDISKSLKIVNSPVEKIVVTSETCRNMQLLHSKTSDQDCGEEVNIKEQPFYMLEILQKAKPEFIQSLDMARSKQTEALNLAFINEYLITHLIFCQFIRPDMIKNMTLHDWVNRDTSKETVICIEQGEDKMSRILTLSREEVEWFDCYFKYVRPLLSKQAKSQHDLHSFFLSKSGKQLSNPTKLVKNLQIRYNMETLVTAGSLRNALKRVARECASENDVNHLNQFLGSTPRTDVQTNIESMKKAHQIIKDVLSYSKEKVQSECSRKYGTVLPKPQDQFCSSATETNENNEQFVVNQAFLEVIVKYPVTPDSSLPQKHIIESCLPEKYRSLYRKVYYKFEYQREKLRICAVAEHFRVFPSKAQIERRVKYLGWCKLSTKKVQELWQSNMSKRTLTLADPDKISQLIESQNWDGLAVAQELPGGKGRGLIAAKHFARGEVICDYHGIQMDNTEGNQYLESLSEEEIWKECYFYKGKCVRTGKSFWVNAGDIPCPCHPDKSTTVGRLMNHNKAGNVENKGLWIKGKHISLCVLQEIYV